MGTVTGVASPGLLRSPAWTAFVSIFTSLPLPACAFLCVFQNDALVQQLLANLVGACKVAALLGLRALLDQRIDFGIADRAVRDRRFQHVEKLIKAGEQI